MNSICSVRSRMIFFSRFLIVERTLRSLENFKLRANFNVLFYSFKFIIFVTIRNFEKFVNFKHFSRDFRFDIFFNMKMLFLLFACTTVIINFGTCTDTDNITIEWKKFKLKYNKKYAGADDDTRKNIFKSNSDMIEKHNTKFDGVSVTFKMGMNEFGDLTHKEFLNRFSVRVEPHKDANVDTENNVHVFDGNVPLQCDWTWLEAVKTVHDQHADCKSGWANSAADAIAARYQVHYKNSCLPLCIDYLTKCSRGIPGNRGCKGGEAIQACELVKKTRKMPDEKSFKNICTLDKMNKTFHLDIKNCVIRTHGDANITMELCNRGPVSAAISAEQPSFQFAKEGIYYEDECYTTPNHEVLLVGYNGIDKDKSYWIVKNSFGTSWGENGFLKISTKANKDGCTIIGNVSYPIF